MVSYYSPLSMYRHQQQATAPTGGPSQFHHAASSAAPWYAPPATYQPPHHPQVAPASVQQYPNCVQEEQPWHHPHHHMFQPEWPPDFASGAGMLPAAGVLEDPQLPSPPITVSSSELSSPGAVARSLTPPQHGGRPARSPYEWMQKPSYQSQSNPGECGGIPVCHSTRFFSVAAEVCSVTERPTRPFKPAALTNDLPTLPMYL
jgi:homeobox protein CDX